MTRLQNKVLAYLTKLAEKDTGYRVGPRYVAREIGESEQAVEQTFNDLVAMGKVNVYINFGQDYWGIK